MCGLIFRCKQRTVTRAYHVCCKECAKNERICAKCLKSADQVNIEPPEPTPEEALQLKVEMDRLVKSLPERKRRTFLRYMNKGKNDEVATNTDKATEDGWFKLQIFHQISNIMYLSNSNIMYNACVFVLI